MSVLLETSVGDIVIDLHADRAPLTCDNFLKLCAVKYYNDCTFHTVRRQHSVQTGDPTNSGSGGQSIHALLATAATERTDASAYSTSSPSRFLQDEIDPSLTHARAGAVGMSNLNIPNSAASQFYITTAPGLHSLDGSHTVFGHVAEGMAVLERINAAVVDERGRPTVHIRIRHTAVLEDPFPMSDAVAALIPPSSPPPLSDPYDYENIHGAQADAQTGDSASTTAAASSPAVNPHAVVLEMIGDLPSADAAPPENILFVCKLNPVTQDDDLQLIFSRFGRIVDCSVVRDAKTGASLCYAFIEYERREDCEAAYVKMDNVLIDDRRIRVDFSQSVSRQWKHFAHNKRAATATRTTNPVASVSSRSAVAGGEGERKSRWGASRPQLPPAAAARAEERKDVSSRAARGEERDSREERRDGDGSSDRMRHGGERRRSRERSAERGRRRGRSRSRSSSGSSSSSSRGRSRGRSRSRDRGDRHKRSHWERERHGSEHDSRRHRGSEKQRDGKEDDRHKEEKERRRRSRSPRRKHDKDS